MRTYTGTIDSVIEDGTALCLLLQRIPEAERTPSVAGIYNKLVENLMELLPGCGGEHEDVGQRSAIARLLAIADAREAFYALPPKELRRALHGWSAVQARPSLKELLNGLGFRRVARMLTVEADNPSNPKPVLRFTHRLVAVPGYAAVRVEVHEGTTRGEVQACLASVSRLFDKHWLELIDRERIATVGTTLDEEGVSPFHGPIRGVDQ
jgi:hypothetical protein